MNWEYVGIGAAVVVPLFVIVVYNTLVRRRNAVENAFAGMDVYLTMRYDLIPNLVATVKGYVKHENETLREVVELRERASSRNLATDDRVRLDNRIAQRMYDLVARAEGYPQLRASENFQQLQRALNEVEERISAARRSFNAHVMDYNNAVESFPSNLVAGALRFGRRAFFEAPAAKRESVSVAGVAG